MFGKKDLERELEQKTQEISLLKKKIDELSDKLVAYHNKEGAIVNAMTEAQASANKTILSAEARRKEIIEEAIASKSRVQNEMRELMEHTNSKANEILADATARANGIIADAQSDAMHLAQNAQAFNENYLRDVAILKDEFKRTADMAAQQADLFRKFYEEMDMTAQEERAGEYVNLTAAVNADNQDELPDDYENPASLMRSIYSIQKRDLPNNVKPQTNDARNTADAQTAFGFGMGAGVNAVVGTAADQPTADAAPEESAAAETSEERIWTVDEIVGEGNDDDDENVELDDELDALIEDVLRGS